MKNYEGKRKNLGLSHSLWANQIYLLPAELVANIAIAPIGARGAHARASDKQ